MSDLSEVIAAPATDEPAASTAQEAAPAQETQDAPEVKTEAEEKTFTQQQLNEIIQKEKAKAEAKAERRALKAYKETLERIVPQQAPQAQQPANDRPTRASYASDDDYVEAMADWKLDQRAKTQRESAEQQQQVKLVSKTENLYAEAAKLPGFDRTEFDELPISRAMAAVLIESDVSAQLMLHMQTHPDEVETIAKMSPARQAAALGKMEDKLSTVPAISKAPAPMKPVGSRGSASNADVSKMSMEEYAAHRAKQGASWARR